jgi:hypothetical protein
VHPGRTDRILLRAGGALSLLAAAWHGAVTPEHFEQWWGYGAFFAVAAFLQAAYGLLLLALGRRDESGPGPTTRTVKGILAAGAIGTLAVIMLYVVTRTVGVPLGPEAGDVEGLGVIDLASKATEALLVVVLAAAWRRVPWHPDMP